MTAFRIWSVEKIRKLSFPNFVFVVFAAQADLEIGAKLSKAKQSTEREREGD